MAEDPDQAASVAAIAGEVEAELLPMEEMAEDPDLDVLVVGTAGRAGLEPTLAALERGTDVALANKEVVVMAGHLLRAAADRGGARLRPVDWRSRRRPVPCPETGQRAPPLCLSSGFLLNERGQNLEGRCIASPAKAGDLAPGDVGDD